MRKRHTPTHALEHASAREQATALLLPTHSHILECTARGRYSLSGQFGRVSRFPPPSRRRLGGFKGLPRPENCKQHSKLLHEGGAARLDLAAQPNALDRAAEQEIRT